MIGWLRRVLPQLRMATPAPHDPADRGEYDRWLQLHDAPSELESAAIRRTLEATPARVALVVDSSNASRAELDRSLRSIEAQTYRNVVVNIARFDGDSVLQSDCDFLGMVSAGDTLSPEAVAVLTAYLVGDPTAAMAYSDEDWVDSEGRRSSPYFKPDWSPDLALVQDYASRLALLRRSAVSPYAAQVRGPSRAALFEMILRLGEGSSRILHAPYVLYHRQQKLTADPGIDRSLRNVADRHLARLGSAGAIEPMKVGVRVRWRQPEPRPLVSLIVPTRDRVDLLATCIEGIRTCTDYPAFEVLILDNESDEPETHAFFQRVQEDSRIRVVPAPGPFNYPVINNLGAREARGEIIGLINNDLKFNHSDWLDELVAQVSRPGVGVAGALLLYGDGSIQHAGCVLGIGGVASHIYKRRDPAGRGHGGRLQVAQDMSAVTAACLLTPRAVWDALGGLDEDLAVAYNDIDYCLRVRKAGLRVIWTPHARVLHLESSSRGDDKAGERRTRLEAEKAKMVARWGDALLRDPFFSPNLSLDTTDCRPAFPPRPRFS